jgi:glycosyltransferase involved in cell wall biosynthesis
MNILLVPGTGIGPESGGQGSFCRYLTEGLRELGHCVEIAGESEWASFCRQNGVPLCQPSRMPRKRMDVVHVNGPGIRAALLGLFSRHPVLLTHQDHRYICPVGTAWTIKGCDESGSGGPCRFCPSRSLGSRLRVSALRRIAARCCNVAVSSYLLRRLRLPNGHAILSPIRAEANSTQSRQDLIAFAGRLEPEKGVGVLLRAVAKLRDVRLEVAGGGAMLPELRRLAEDLGIGARVHFLGVQPLQVVRELYLRSAVVCVPSIWHEPFGYAAAEALAWGRALVASDRGAFAELAGGGRGWICRADDPDEWASTLMQVLQDDDERTRRSQLATQFVAEELDPVRVARRYVSLYEAHAGIWGSGSGMRKDQAGRNPNDANDSRRLRKSSGAKSDVMKSSDHVWRQWMHSRSRDRG